MLLIVAGCDVNSRRESELVTATGPRAPAATPPPSAEATALHWSMPALALDGWLEVATVKGNVQTVV